MTPLIIGLAVVILLLAALEITIAVGALLTAAGKNNKIYDISKVNLTPEQARKRARIVGTTLIISGTLSVALAVFFIVMGISLSN